MRHALKAIGPTFACAALLASLPLAPAYAQTDVQVDWVRHYVSGFDPDFAYANAVTVDASGNVYVTGGSYGSNQLPDYATIKYSSSGDTLWVARYNGPGDNWDAATDVAVDTSGNVYVTGQSYGPDDFDYVTIKYGPSGGQQWIARYDGAASEDWPNGLVVDAAGNVYVTGYSLGSGTFYDYATVKYDAAGMQEWAARYNGPGNTKDRAWALAVDGSGNVYVTGDSGEGSLNLSDYVTVKYSPSGAQRWAARYDNSYDYPTALALDASGNVYVTGYSYGFGTYYDYATVKYSPRGSQRWASRFHGGIGDDLAYALAVDASGNVYVTGESVGSGTGGDYGTVKYDARGTERWVARYDGLGGLATDSAVAVAVDGAGGVYVTGESAGSDLVTDYATVKYSDLGARQWVARNGPKSTYDHPAELAIDAAGNVAVTGTSSKLGGGAYTTIKYTQSFTSTGLDP